MNLFWSVFVLYILPMVIYTMGKNEYAENANEHLLSQRSLMRESNEHSYDCSDVMVQMELETISWDLYYLQAIGSVSSRSSILYYLKTYNTNPVDENTIIEQGRALHVSGEETFRISVRTQGVYMVYLLAKDTTTLCNSPVLTIPLFSAFEEKSPLHIWSPQLHFSSAGCILTCSISSPSFLYFLLEKNPSSHDTHRKTSQEIRSLGFDGGRFADEASFFIGSLADAGNYHMWMVLEADGKLSDPYLYEFVIPECFLEGSISLLHSIEDDQEALSLSVEVKVASYPVSLVILAELRDKHGIRPSADDVSRRGQAFEISSSEVTVLNYQSGFQGNRILWMILRSPDEHCLSNVFRFVHMASSSSAELLFLSLSSPLISPVLSSASNTSVIEFYRLAGVIQLQGVELGDCELYYSLSQQQPSPIEERVPIGMRLADGVSAYSFLVMASELDAMVAPAILHITGEISVDVQSHRTVERAVLHSCDALDLRMDIVGVQKNGKLRVHGIVTQTAELIHYEPLSGVLEKEMSGLLTVAKGRVFASGEETSFIMDMNPLKSSIVYFVARRGNCLSATACVNLTSSS
ncbi:hypothetical protein WA538_005308, partial [Blastocystis sp. DL]